MAVLCSSPALGTGDPALLGTTDQRGFVRAGSVNIGAYQDPLPVHPVPLVAPSRTYRVVFNTALTTTLVNGLLANFVDPNCLRPTVVAGSVHTAHGTLSLNADGTFSYQPNAGFRANDTFTYRITDGAVTSAEATVTLIVGQPPVAAGLCYSVNGGDTLIVGAANGLVGANGDTGGVAHFVGWVPGSPTGARGLTLNADGSFTFTAPSGTPNEVVTFQYYVTNPDGTSGIGTVDIAIHGLGILPPPGKFPQQPPSTTRPL
jgi:VCBS repeat-containing protein